jgi:protein-L-isoaspartate O-methyltransferase
MIKLRIWWRGWSEVALRVLTVAASLASLIALLPAFLPSPTKLPAWAIGLIALAGLSFITFVTLEILNRRTRRVFAKTDTKGIGNYMHRWIEHAGRVAIWTRDLSWAEEPSAKALLTDKARRKELIICLPVLNDTASQLLAAGAEICAYGAERIEAPASRFTIAFFGRAGSRVAVGRADGDLHVIDEFSADEHHGRSYRTRSLRMPRRAAMSHFKPHRLRSQADITREWDRLAKERDRQIASGEDISFDKVVTPAVWQLLEPADKAVVLDIGSGTGHFTARLAKAAGRVIALDPSSASMAIARRVCQSVSNVAFVESTLEEASSLDDLRATSAVAVMTLMTVVDLHRFATALTTVLSDAGSFVAVITHPCFWPAYWGYEKEPWFEYHNQIFIEAPFRISRHKARTRTTHAHRPLSEYVNIFAGSGFRLDELVEPYPSPQIESLYPAKWDFPRFLGLRWQKSA